jgi:hypothetical protein
MRKESNEARPFTPAFALAGVSRLMGFLRQPRSPISSDALLEAYGDAAQSMLANDPIVRAFENTTNGYIEQLVNTGPDDAQAREYLHHRLAALQDVMMDLRGAIDAASAIKDAREHEENERHRVEY